MIRIGEIWESKSLIRMVVMVVLLASSNGCFANESQKYGADFHVVHSEASGQSYRLWVFKPKGYSLDKGPPLPAVYSLTLKSNDIPSTAEGYYKAISSGGVADHFLVAIGFESDLEHEGLRSAQMTSTNNPEYDSSHLNKIKGEWPEGIAIDEKMKSRWRSGQAQLLSDAIRKNIVPFVDKRYNTSDDRGLAGHSLGGLFVTDFMLSNPGLFNRYWIASPSYWWNTVDLFRKEIDYANSFDDLNARVYFSVGGLEGESMTVLLGLFVALLESRKYPGLDVEYEVMEGEGHMSIIQPSVRKGMEYLFPEG